MPDDFIPPPDQSELVKEIKTLNGLLTTLNTTLSALPGNVSALGMAIAAQQDAIVGALHEVRDRLPTALSSDRLKVEIP